MRYETPAPPAEVGKTDGLAYTLWLPEGDPWAGVVIIHGAGSSKESHHDFARAARSAGLSAVCFDQRGHGDSGGELDGRALEDVATVAALLGDVPLATRGSSMGGYLAILAAERLGAAAVVAICPASADGLLRGLRGGELDFPADVPAVEAFLAEHPLERRAPGRAAAAPARRGRRARAGRPLARAGADRAERRARGRPRRASPLGPARRRAAGSRPPLAAEGRLTTPATVGGGRRRCVASWRRRGDHDAALANGGQLHHAVVAPHSRERDEGEEEHQDEQRDDSGRPGPARPGEESALHVRGLETLPSPKTRGCFRATGRTSVLSASG